MAQSPEYPDLAWMPPKSWTDANRTSVQLVVIHTTEGSEGPASAEDGAAYDQRRTDGTSTHYFHDSNTTVQCVRTADQAHAARTQGNRRGIQHELCGRAGQGSAGWADAVSQGTLRQAAKQVARDCKKWGIPVRKLSAGQVASGLKGLCGHVEITYAFPQDNGTHTDPGPTFPWSAFLALVQDFMDGDDVLKDEQIVIGDSAKPLFEAGRDSAPASEWLSLAAINGYRATSAAAALAATVAQLNTVAAGILANVKADDGEKAAILADAQAKHAEILAAVSQVDEQVWAKVPDPGISAEETANLLRPLLGDKAAAVGALLAA